MAREQPTTAYTEVQIDEDSINLTLITEGGNGAVVEDTERLTFDDLQSMAGEIRSLRLSTETREAMSPTRDMSTDELLEHMGLTIEAGDVLVDDNPAPWSDDTQVVVERVLSDVRADEHQPPALEGETVATANPSYPDDDAVILGHYVGSTKTYAFPESRLVEPDSDTISQKEWHDKYGN